MLCIDYATHDSVRLIYTAQKKYLVNGSTPKSMAARPYRLVQAQCQV